MAIFSLLRILLLAWGLLIYLRETTRRARRRDTRLLVLVRGAVAVFLICGILVTARQLQGEAALGLPEASRFFVDGILVVTMIWGIMLLGSLRSVQPEGELLPLGPMRWVFPLVTFATMLLWFAVEVPAYDRATPLRIMVAVLGLAFLGAVLLRPRRIWTHPDVVALQERIGAPILALGALGVGALLFWAAARF